MPIETDYVLSILAQVDGIPLSYDPQYFENRHSKGAKILQVTWYQGKYDNKTQLGTAFPWSKGDKRRYIVQTILDAGVRDMLAKGCDIKCRVKIQKNKKTRNAEASFQTFRNNYERGRQQGRSYFIYIACGILVLLLGILAAGMFIPGDMKTGQKTDDTFTYSDYRDKMEIPTPHPKTKLEIYKESYEYKKAAQILTAYHMPFTTKQFGKACGAWLKIYHPDKPKNTQQQKATSDEIRDVIAAKKKFPRGKQMNENV